MAMRRAVLLVAIILAGCDRHAPPIAAYVNPIDGYARILPLEVLGIHSCAKERTANGKTVIEGIPFDQCYKMLPAKRMRGVWLDEFEGSRFFEDVDHPDQVIAALRHERDAKLWPFGEWLGWGKAREPETPPRSRMVLIDFVGRRTAVPGSYGHGGGSRSEVLVDKVLSARVIYRAKGNYLDDEI
ncbi:hypothetical protein [Sphingomonas sp.]|uniref:hypothetical protein n=1 Tax=Sphingomonas sp. TaxID=28214 RepID=UPI003B3BBED4